MSRIRDYAEGLYYGWLEDGARVHPSWSVGSIRDLYRRLLRALVYAGVPNAYDVVEELLDQADPSEPLREFERWAREYIKKQYGAVV